ncbi:hypothetical protein [Francisella philomiragia]|uniref:hypothetical protein n=1 Tax=Francisella philomiragia TaxID=28110 RepID=UPI002243C9B9|nr:hypothetical protein [Francisella philomiragia]
MNIWTKMSFDFANQRNYLDELFKVYPTIPDGIRDIDENKWNNIEIAFDERNNQKLIESLLKLELFPIKDSYVAYLKKDKTALSRNPRTIDRLAGRLYEMGLDNIFERCSEPKETNRQIGPLFRNWVNKGCLGLQPVPLSDFIQSSNDAILLANDEQMKSFAIERLGYKGKKGLDFIARFNNRYIVGEAKFLTDFGGHQNAQYNDAINLINSEFNNDVIKIAILDGVLYIPSVRRNSMSIKSELNILSALVLREFLYSL